MTFQAVEHSSIQDRVITICNDLYTKGTKPTVRLVLSMLPDVSSTSTVHKYFKQWKDEQEASQQSLYDKLGFSEEFTRGFMKEITRFGVQAEQRYKDKAMDACEQQEKALEDLERAEERLYKQNALYQQQSKELEELRAEIGHLQNGFKATESEQKKQHQAIENELRKQVEEQKNEIKELRESSESISTELAKSQLKMEGNQELVEEMKRQNLMLTAENKALSVDIVSMAKTTATLESTVQGNDKLIQQLQESQVNMDKFVSRIEGECSAVVIDRDNLKHALNESEKTLNAAQNRVEEDAQIISDLKVSANEKSRVIDTLTKNGG